MKTLIWDYNGTIVDDVNVSLKVENYMLRERGMKYGYTREEYKDLFCFPITEYYRKLGYTFESESFEQLSEEYNRLYDEMFSECTIVEGTADKIKEASSYGFRNVIISACRNDKLHKQMKLLHAEQSFDEMLGIENDLGGSKIDMAKGWMMSTDTDPNECMYIGDTLHDMDTAVSMGIEKYVLVACGHQSYKVLHEKTNHVVHTMEEVRI
jgi:phosphoglycolate phosphatase